MAIVLFLITTLVSRHEEYSRTENQRIHPSFASWLRGSERAVTSYTSPETQFFHKTGFLHAFLRCSRGTLLMAIATC
ncbi:MAG: hypothetical protein EBE86_021025 [Hormoscilla sp. GUM202]|nr:hypothetical protein [Hormoscilla sp. GUM202]